MDMTQSYSTTGLWILLIVGVMLRWIVSFYDYSGKGNLPIFGDYEAQRHWMEVTVNLHPQEWYANTSKNDLQYWGLDYPPLTAYHSFICGYFAYFLNPAYVEFNTSRGYESPEHKLFMRSTVLISDLFSYMAAVCIISKSTRSHLLAMVSLIYPGLILIDHGHFQYNCISLGLALYSFTAFIKNHDILGSVLFCLALNFKQMILYYALPVFFYLLGKCVKLGWKSGIFKLAMLGLSVIMTFLILWWPFWGVSVQVIKRLFPIERGLFEDKVSNMWCFINIFIKVRNYFENRQLAIISAFITVLAVIPSSLDVFIHPTPRKFFLSLINSSLGFFLFSYQVHEKTILLVSLPVMLFYEQNPLGCLWFLLISSFSMLPLLLKDALFIPFLSLNIIYIILCCFMSNEKVKISNPYLFKVSFLLLSFISSFLLIIFTLTVSPPSRYPHLYSLLLSAHCAVHFFCFFIYFNLIQLTRIKKS